MYRLLLTVRLCVRMYADSFLASLDTTRKLMVFQCIVGFCICRCMRLNLVPLAYLWRRDQTELLQEMIDCKVQSILIKVASLGLVPDRHLGKSLRDLQPHLEKMREKYGLNVCGEGGEYETFTLNCPLFKQQICV